ncbi:hypothetical protein EJB05_11603, partial [Eragrostis curvula]
HCSAVGPTRHTQPANRTRAALLKFRSAHSAPATHRFFLSSQDSPPGCVPPPPHSPPPAVHATLPRGLRSASSSPPPETVAASIVVVSENSVNSDAGACGRWLPALQEILF